ncbi:hypothetical protein N7451_005805 [Penicillium sp. IBT 35674x]|nr:hypothetical protein N7451_005805 [Penicillium sp. IBT 35674x]
MRRLYDGSKDPSGPNTAKYMPRAKQATQKHLKRPDLVRPLDVNDMFLKDSYDVATIARDVLVTAGKHPSEKPLNYHLHALMKTVPVLDHSSDLATLRWEGIDPLIYARDKRPRNTSTRPPAQPINAIGAVAPPSSHGNSLPPQPASLPSSPHNSHSAKFNSSIPTPPPIPSTPVPAPERAPSKPQAAAETPTPKLSSAPRSKIPSASPRAVPAAQSPRTKGSLQPQVVIRSPQKMPPVTKKAGRPKKDARSDNIAVTVPSPDEPPIQFPVFKCLWEKCQMELHSLVLLQQHVLKAHIPHNITCGWKECDHSDPMPASALWEHLRERHFKDYAWALGDGPAVPSPGEDDQVESPFVPQFDLFDRQARPATVLLPLDDYVVAGYSKSHGIKNSKQRAELFKDAGCRWKEEAGPDVDISDRRLSTPPRLVTSRLTEIAMTPSESP